METVAWKEDETETLRILRDGNLGPALGSRSRNLVRDSDSIHHCVLVRDPRRRHLRHQTPEAGPGPVLGHIDSSLGDEEASQPGDGLVIEYLCTGMADEEA